MLTSISPSTIAIVGAGFSGSLVAVHLLQTTTCPLRIKLIDRRHRLGQGIAYQTSAATHLLNVPVGKMSAFPHDPDHLLRWLKRHRYELTEWLPDEFSANCFIPRQVYGLYLQSILKEAEIMAASNVRLERVIDEVVAVEPQSQGAMLTLRNCQIVADKIVLALGNTSATDLSLADNAAIDIRDAWSVDALTDLRTDAPILLVGTGLTMIDRVMSLREQQHQGQIYAVSRRGLLPRSHLPSPHSPALHLPALPTRLVNFTPELAPRTVRGLMQLIRNEVKTATASHTDWRTVIDSLRPFTQQLWQQLPRPEQQRFLRHVNPYWDVHRHRVAPEIQHIVQAMLKSGQLQIMAGRIQGYQREPGRVAVQVRQRYAATNLVLQVCRVINCTGTRIDYRQATHPLIANLRDQGLIAPSDLGLGMETAADGAVLDAQGHRSDLLYTLGTPRKGTLWETTAVPELRGQAKALAATILRSLPGSEPCSTIPSKINNHDRETITEIDRGKIKQMLSAQIETYENYFAMYI